MQDRREVQSLGPLGMPGVPGLPAGPAPGVPGPLVDHGQKNVMNVEPPRGAPVGDLADLMKLAEEQEGRGTHYLQVRLSDERGSTLRLGPRWMVRPTDELKRAIEEMGWTVGLTFTYMGRWR